MDKYFGVDVKPTKAPVSDKKLAELYRHCLQKGWVFIPPKHWVEHKAA